MNDCYDCKHGLIYTFTNSDHRTFNFHACTKHNFFWKNSNPCFSYSYGGLIKTKTILPEHSTNERILLR